MDANHITTPNPDRLTAAGNPPRRPATNADVSGPLYWNQHTGLVTCLNHAGHYLTAALHHDPEATSVPTPLGTWNRVRATDRRDWTEELGVEISCETCTHAH